MPARYPTVLVVDDDPSIRRLLELLLERQGWQVLAAAGVADALAVIHAGDAVPVDVVILDAILPDGHGADLAERIVGHPRTATVGVCFLSGSARAADNGAVGIRWVPKPATTGQVVRAVSALLRWRARGGAPAAARRAALSRLTCHLPA